MKFFYYIKRLTEIPVPERKLFLKGIFVILFIKLVVLLLPIKYYLGMLKSQPGCIISEQEKQLKISITRKTIRRIVRFTPWHYSCLVKSIMMKLILNAFGIESYVALQAIKRNSPRLTAHAFVCIHNHNFNFYLAEGNKVFIIK